MFLPNVSDVIRALGADVTVLNGTYDECIAMAREMAEAHDWVIVSDTSWPGYSEIPNDIVNGYCTLFTEALDQMESPPTHVIVQAGVGTFADGSLSCSSSLYPARLCGTGGRRLSVRKTSRVDTQQTRCNHVLGTTNSCMQGLNCGTPSTDAYTFIKDRVDDFVAVGDLYARKAVKWLHRKGLPSSPTGSAGLACYLAAKKELKITSSSRVLLILTEGVTDTVQFESMTAHAH